MSQPSSPSAYVGEEAHRLLAFIYFACAEADAAWTNEETFALYEFLERHAGGLTRERSVELAREAYARVLEVPGNEVRLREIEAQVPLVFAHLGEETRREILDELLELALTDGKVSRDEAAMHARIRRALLGDASTDLPELRLVAYIFQLLARADGRIDSGEVGKIRAFLRARDPKATKRQIRETVEQAGAWYDSAADDAARIDLLKRVARGLHWTLDARQRNDLLVELMRVASADGHAEAGEGSLVRAIRAALIDQFHPDEIRVLAFIYFTCAEADGSWTNQETIALYDLLERHGGPGRRDEVVALAQESYLRILGIADLEERLRVIREEAPSALGRLREEEREAILAEVLELSRLDDRVSGREGKVRDAVRSALFRR